MKPFSQASLSFGDLFLINFSMLLVFSSLGIFSFTYHIPKLDLIKLPYPSRARAKSGTIKIGKVMYKDHIKYKFYLSLRDLQGHMFITGTTGKGKSNFLQNLLLNFKKQYKIPFLLAEFKGEYIFLQKKFSDVLVLRPGENITINIFDPADSNPFIHAERLFEIFRSGGLIESREYTPQMEKV
ncbi:unnamed protein product, partial [marine sediment metagenome]